MSLSKEILAYVDKCTYKVVLRSIVYNNNKKKRTNINAQGDKVGVADIDGGGEKGHFLFYSLYFS